MPEHTNDKAPEREAPAADEADPEAEAKPKKRGRGRPPERPVLGAKYSEAVRTAAQADRQERCNRGCSNHWSAKAVRGYLPNGPVQDLCRARGAH